MILFVFLVCLESLYQPACPIDFILPFISPLNVSRFIWIIALQVIATRALTGMRMKIVNQCEVTYKEYRLACKAGLTKARPGILVAVLAGSLSIMLLFVLFLPQAGMLANLISNFSFSMLCITLFTAALTALFIWMLLAYKWFVSVYVARDFFNSAFGRATTRKQKLTIKVEATASGINVRMGKKAYSHYAPGELQVAQNAHGRLVLRGPSREVYKVRDQLRDFLIAQAQVHSIAILKDDGYTQGDKATMLALLAEAEEESSTSLRLRENPEPETEPLTYAPAIRLIAKAFAQALDINSHSVNIEPAAVPSTAKLRNEELMVFGLDPLFNEHTNLLSYLQDNLALLSNPDVIRPSVEVVADIIETESPGYIKAGKPLYVTMSHRSDPGWEGQPVFTINIHWLT
jgi:hypothetical protein